MPNNCYALCAGGNPCAANPNVSHTIHACTDAACCCHKRHNTAACTESLAFERTMDRLGHLPETAHVLALAAQWRELRTALLAAGWPAACITVEVIAAYVPDWQSRTEKPKSTHD